MTLSRVGSGRVGSVKNPFPANEYLATEKKRIRYRNDKQV